MAEWTTNCTSAPVADIKLFSETFTNECFFYKNTKYTLRLLIRDGVVHMTLRPN